ncbi:MAG TPA: hypothetical protein VFD59_01045 [Nocardioidaceae bacterium]|nr:hypothetical protein [Nocardioidaceae bacterium]
MNRYPARWAVTALVLAVSLALALTWAGAGGWFDRDPPARGSPTTGTGERGSFADPMPGPSGSRVPAAVHAEPGSPPAVAIVRRWDRKRARAYARGDADALSGLYAFGSEVGTSDVALLRSYLHRGLRVEGLRMQLLAVEVLDHTSRRWRLRVTDRVHGGVAVGAGKRVMLPRDEATTHVVTLLRVRDSTWKVAAVHG